MSSALADGPSGYPPHCALPECRAAYAMEYVRDACTAEQLAQLHENMLGAPSDAGCVPWGWRSSVPGLFFFKCNKLLEKFQEVRQYFASTQIPELTSDEPSASVVYAHSLVAPWNVC